MLSAQPWRENLRSPPANASSQNYTLARLIKDGTGENPSVIQTYQLNDNAVKLLRDHTRAFEFPLAAAMVPHSACPSSVVLALAVNKDPHHSQVYANYAIFHSTAQQASQGEASASSTEALYY